MALRIIKKDEKTVEPPRLPEGGDRFLWDEVPTVKQEPAQKRPEYAKILKKKAT